MIKDFYDGLKVSKVFLLKEMSKGVTTTGSTYLNLTLQDKTGTIDGKRWDATQQELDIFVPGEAVEVTGDVYEYKGKLQLKVLSAKKVDQSTINLDDLIMGSPIPVEELIEKFKKHFDSVKNKDCKAILTEIFNRYYKEFIDYPAASRNHHEFYHGLLYHTVTMCDVADALRNIYKDVDYDLVITGCLLHDIGKVIELSGPISTKYTVKGNLLGHLAIGMALIKEVSDELKIDSEIPMLLEHMVLSHHGKLEYGSCVLPCTKEALLLSMIDDLDAKMMICTKALTNVDEGSFSERIFALDGRSLYKPN